MYFMTPETKGFAPFKKQLLGVKNQRAKVTLKQRSVDSYRFKDWSIPGVC